MNTIKTKCTSVRQPFTKEFELLRVRIREAKHYAYQLYKQDRHNQLDKELFLSGFEEGVRFAQEQLLINKQ